MDAPTAQPLLPALVALPALAAAALAAAPRWAARGATLAVMGLVAAMAWTLDPPANGTPLVWSAEWIPSIGAQALLGVDGLSLPLVLLTATLCPIAHLAAGSVTERPRRFCALMLLLETGMLGVFLALDFVLFYVCWELLLVPMYFLIGLWGGAGRRAAAVKFFVFTLVGGLLMLAAGLLVYGASDLTRLSPQRLADAGVFGPAAVGADDAVAAQRAWFAGGGSASARFADAEAAGRPVRTFNLLALATLGQTTDAFTTPTWSGKPLAFWVFVLLLGAFLIKLPAVPVHTWLPAAHVEAPTAVSMLLAGVMLKLGGYGLVRVAWPLCPEAAVELSGVVATLGAVSIVWGALAALAQDDFKRLVAYSSVSHMGYVLLGLAAGSAAASAGDGVRSTAAELWTLGASGAVFQMVGHGVTSAGLFFAVGVLYERAGHRDLRRLGGLMDRMPLAAGLTILLAMASLGMPGLCGFVGELMTLLAAWAAHPGAVVAAAVGTVLTAAYTLRALRLAYFGAEHRGDAPEKMTPLTARELAVLAPLAVAAVLLGVRPQPVLDRVEPPLAATAAALGVTPAEPKLAATPRPPSPPDPARDAARTVRNAVR